MADVETVERVIPAPPEAIFALLVDPRRHHDIDGSGSVKAAKGDPSALTLGSKFGMSMRLGVPYSTLNTVIEFEPNRRIAWRTCPAAPGPIARLVAGRTWRYELEPVEGGTRVRETWDITTEAPLTRPIVRRAAKSTRKAMAATLARIEELVTA
jgi:uncharacterized protein YndB with AHSA1/START domain